MRSNSRAHLAPLGLKWQRKDNNYGIYKSYNLEECSNYQICVELGKEIIKTPDFFSLPSDFLPVFSIGQIQQESKCSIIQDMEPIAVTSGII